MFFFNSSSKGNMSKIKLYIQFTVQIYIILLAVFDLFVFKLKLTPIQFRYDIVLFEV